MLVPPLDRTLAASGVSRSCKGNARPKLVPVSTLLPGEQFLGHGVMRPWSIHKFLPHLPRHTEPFPNAPCLNMPYLTCLIKPRLDLPFPTGSCTTGSCPTQPALPSITEPRRDQSQRNPPYLPHLSSPPVPGQTCPN